MIRHVVVFHDPSTRRGSMRNLSTLSKLITVATLLCVVALPYAKGEVPQTPQAKEYLRKLDEPIILRGDYFKATLVAYNDFLQVLAANAAAANMHTSPDNAESYTKLSKIENFDMTIQQSDSSYTVQIGPTSRGDMPLVFGGGARYQIDRKTFSIISKTLLK
jgi:hypothetical protein